MDEPEILIILYKLLLRWQPHLGQTYFWRLQKINPRPLWLFFPLLSEDEKSTNEEVVSNLCLEL